MKGRDNVAAVAVAVVVVVFLGDGASRSSLPPSLDDEVDEAECISVY